MAPIAEALQTPEGTARLVDLAAANIVTDAAVDVAPNATATPALSVVVVSWNTRELLTRCLESVRQSRATGGIEVVVVDNASVDGSAQVVRERFPWVRLLANTENVGFARANNQAIPWTTGRYVLLLNPDTEVEPDAIETLLRFMEDHPQAGAAGPRLMGGDGAVQRSCHPAPTLSRELWRLFHLDTLRPLAWYPIENWDQRTARPVDVVQGACMMVRREALQQAGLLDEQYFIYSEEVDLCYRLRQHAWEIWWVPRATVVHHGGQSTRQVAAAMFLRLYQSKVLYFRKNYGPHAAQRYKLILLGATVARLLLLPFVWLWPKPQRRQFLTLAAHYCQLIKTLPGL